MIDSLMRTPTLKDGLPLTDTPVGVRGLSAIQNVALSVAAADASEEMVVLRVAVTGGS
jgi:hypothetical protein